VEIYFAIQLKDKAEKKWFQLIDETVQFKEIEEISAKIKMIYDYSNSVNSAKGLLSQTSSSLSLVVPEAKDAKGANKDEKRFVIEFDPPAACDNGIGDTHYQQCDRKFNFFRSKSLINKDNKDGSEAEGLSNNITNNSNNDGDRQFKNYNCKIKQSRYNNDEFNDINIAAKFSCSSNSKEHCISGDCSMNPDIIIEEETAQKDDLNKLTNSNQIKDDCQKNEMKSADYLFLKQNNYNNNNDNNNNNNNFFQINQLNQTNKIEMSVENSNYANATYSSNYLACNNSNKNNIDNKPFHNKPFTNNNDIIANTTNNNFNNKKNFTNNFEKEFLLKLNTYSSDFSRIKREEHLKI